MAAGAPAKLCHRTFYIGHSLIFCMVRLAVVACTATHGATHVQCVVEVHLTCPGDCPRSEADAAAMITKVARQRLPNSNTDVVSAHTQLA